MIKFSKSDDLKHFVLGIREENGNISYFNLSPDATLSNNALKVVERLNPELIAIEDSEWREYIEPLIQPPTGVPNDKGIRESDKLAADPHDPKKTYGGG